MFVPIDETLRAYEDLVTAGKVRYIGCSNHSAWQVMKALATSERIGAPRYICQQVQLLARVARRRARDCSARAGSGRRADGVEPAARRPADRQVPARHTAPTVARLNELDVPGTVDFDRALSHRRRARRDCQGAGRVDPAGRAQLGAAQAGRRHGHSRRAQRGAAARHSRRRPTWRLTPEESARLDEVSALPEPYPLWHQHKFGIERNPRPGRIPNP